MPRPLDGPPRPAAPRAIGALLLRRPRAWLVPTALVAGATALVLAATPARYTARSEILIETGATTFARADVGDSATAEAVGDATVASAAQALGSTDLARRTIKALHLQSDPAFDPPAGGVNPLSRFMTLFGMIHDPVHETADARRMETFEAGLAVQAPPGTRVITLEFTNRDPQLAARVVNEVADLFLDQRAAASRAAAKATTDALATRIAALRVDLSDAEASRSTSQAGRDAASAGRDTAALLARARAEQTDAQGKADAIRDLLREGRAADVAEIAASATLRQLASQRAEAQTELTQAARTLLPEHPRIKELTGQIKDDDAALKIAAKQLAASLDAQSRLAGQRVADLEAKLAREQGPTSPAGLDVGRSSAANRDVQGLREQLGALTDRYDRLLAAQPSPDAHVVLRAAPPRAPSFPKPVPIVIGAALATMLCSMVWIVARDDRSPRLAVDGQQPGSAEADEDVSVEADPIVEPEREQRPAVPRRGPLARFAGPELSVHDDEPDAILLPPVPPASTRSAVAFFARAQAFLTRSKAGLVAFGRPGSDSRDRDVADRIGFDGGEGGVGWDVEPAQADEAPIERENVVDRGTLDPDALDPDTLDHVAIADRIVAGHVPGRGLHVVGTGIGSDVAASRDLVAMSRALAERGRCIVVDLNATPSRLASLGAAENGRSAVTTLDGLAELLAGEASFAEVIHRDHATRLHFIPTGRKEADFRDFDLILDALTETYDFIVLLAPAFPQSEIAKVMAPYADLVVLSAPADVDGATLDRLEAELNVAGAREVLVTGGRIASRGSRARVA